jgi:hypothetical protein
MTQVIAEIPKILQTAVMEQLGTQVVSMFTIHFTNGTKTTNFLKESSPAIKIGLCTTMLSERGHGADKVSAHY